MWKGSMTSRRRCSGGRLHLRLHDGRLHPDPGRARSTSSSIHLHVVAHFTMCWSPDRVGDVRRLHTGRRNGPA
jgi:hypothetical protein